MLVTPIPLNTASPASLAMLSVASDFWDDVFYQAAGMFVVLGALTGLWMAVAVVGRCVAVADRRVRPAASVARAKDVAAPEAEDAGPAPDIVAVIAAAVSATLERRHRVVSVELVPGTPAWSAEGRREIAQSHRIR